MWRNQLRNIRRSAVPRASNRNICIASTTPLLQVPPQYNALKQVQNRSTIYRSLRFHSTPVGKIDKPTYQLTFTCKACNHRSSHLVTKQAYHNGTVLIQCPSCRNRHLIADHLNVFGQGKKNLEDILKEKGDGEVVQKKTIDLNKLGDIEWEGPGEAPEQIKIEGSDKGK